MKFQINNTQYWIDEFTDGFAWVSDRDEGTVCFPTVYEAYCNAWDYENLKSDMREQQLADELENEIYGTYEQQVNKLYYGSRL